MTDLDVLREWFTEELHDAQKYAEMADRAHHGGECILRDIAKEELGHAKHLCRILKKHGVEVDFEKESRAAKRAIWK